MLKTISDFCRGGRMRKLGAAAASALVLTASVATSVQAQETAYYYVSVKTADQEDAGTDAEKISITLHGTAGSSNWVELDTKDHDDFERNEWGTYLLTTPQNLGRIMYITLKMEGKKSDDGWKPAVVYVLGPNIKTERSDGKVWRTDDVVYNGNRRNGLDFYRFPPGNPDAELDSDIGITELTFQRVNNWINDQTIADTDKNQRVVESERAKNNINMIPEGRWEAVGSGSQKISTEIKRGYSFENQRSDTEIKALSASLAASVTAGMEVSASADIGAASAGTTASVSATASAEVRRETSNEITNFASRSSSGEEQCSTENEFYSDQTVTVYQWKVRTDMSGKGDNVWFSTCHLACATTAERAKLDAEARPGDLKGLNCTRFREKKS